MGKAISERHRWALEQLSECRLWTIDHFATLSGYSRAHAAELLHQDKLRGYFDTIGDVPLAGKGRAPKVYLFTKPGWQAFHKDHDCHLAPYRQAKPKEPWSSSLPHRLQTTNFFVLLMQAFNETGSGQLLNLAFDFRMVKHRGTTMRETKDQFTDERGRLYKIIPDAAFHIRRADGAQALIFLETDMGREVVLRGRGNSASLEAKFQTYAAYLHSQAYQERYAHWHSFQNFILVFVTTTEARVARVRDELGSKTPSLWPFAKLTTHAAFEADPLGPIWTSLNPKDNIASSLLGDGDVV